jgi:hypothetical protein
MIKFLLCLVENWLWFTCLNFHDLFWFYCLRWFTNLEKTEGNDVQYTTHAWLQHILVLCKYSTYCMFQYLPEGCQKRVFVAIFDRNKKIENCQNGRFFMPAVCTLLLYYHRSHTECSVLHSSYTVLCRCTIRGVHKLSKQ